MPNKGVLIWLLFIMGLTAGACASSLETGTDASGRLVEEILNQLSFEQVNRFVEQINQESKESIPLLNFETIQQLMKQGLSVSFTELGVRIMQWLFEELIHQAHWLGKLIFLTVLCALLNHLHQSLGQSGISGLAYGVSFSLLAVLAMQAFYQVMTLASKTVDTMVSFMQALLPILLTLLLGVGGLTSAALLSPVMLFVVQATGLAVKNILLPLLFLSALLECVNYLSDHYRLSRLAGLLQQWSMIGMGFVMVLFVGVIAIQGAAGSVTDGIGLRTAKFATATFIPVVGKMFADTVEVVMGASLLLKNVIGLFGLLVIVTIVTIPLIKMLALILIIKLGGALVEPLGDEKMAHFLDKLGNHLFLILGAVMAVALMFFLAMTILIAVGSVTLMLR